MDVIDQAQKQIEQALERALKQRRAEPEAVFTGRCLWCDDPVPAPRRWCCAKCRDDWEVFHGLRR
jgi:hypothetical protein